MNTETEKPTVVEEVKKTVDVANTLQTSIKAIANVASSDTVSNVIRIVALLLMGLGWFLIKGRLKKILIEKANELSEHERQELKDYLAGIQNRTDDSVVTDLEQGF